jgi:hypothetical protein
MKVEIDAEHLTQMHNTIEMLKMQNSELETTIRDIERNKTINAKQALKIN